MIEDTPELNAIQKGKAAFRKFEREHAQHQVDKDVPDCACIDEHAIVMDGAWIGGHSVIKGSARVTSRAFLKGDAHIESENDVFTAGPFNGQYLTAFKDSELGVRICFSDMPPDISSFKKEIEEKFQSRHRELARLKACCQLTEEVFDDVDGE